LERKWVNGRSAKEPANEPKRVSKSADIAKLLFPQVFLHGVLSATCKSSKNSLNYQHHTTGITLSNLSLTQFTNDHALITQNDAPFTPASPFADDPAANCLKITAHEASRSKSSHETVIGKAGIYFCHTDMDDRLSTARSSHDGDFAHK
jgi:hypothetical protein